MIQKFGVKSKDEKASVSVKASRGSILTVSYNQSFGVVDPDIVKTSGFNFENRRYTFPIPFPEVTSNSKIAEQ